MQYRSARTQAAPPADVPHTPGRRDDADVPDLVTLLLETAPFFTDYVVSYLRHASPVDSGTHFGVLRMLRANDLPIHLIAERHGVRMPTMSRTVDTLEQRGWVERLRAPHDRRSVLVRITRTGRQVLREVEEMAEARVGRLLNEVSDEGREHLRAGLVELAGALASQHEGGTHGAS